MKKDVARGRPFVIPKEDYAQIIADVTTGKRKPSDIAKDYKKPNGTPIAQSNINRIVQEWRDKQNLTKRDTEDMSITIQRIYKQHIELQQELDRYGDVGKIILSDVVNAQSIRLQAHGYAPIIKKFKDKINTLLDNNQVYEIVGTGQGSQMILPRDTTVQDFGNLEKGVKTLNMLANMECITQTTPTVAIQNNNSAEAKVEVKKEPISSVINGAFASVETVEKEKENLDV